MVRDVGRGQLLGRAAEDARDVDRDVSDADHGDPLGRQVELVVLVVRMPVEPGHEVGRGVAAQEVLTRNAHAPVGLGSGGEADLVEARPQLVECDVTSDVHVPEEAKGVVHGDPVENAGHALDLLVVWGDAETDEPERRGEPVEHVHAHRDVALLEEPLGHVEAGWPRSDDRHPEGVVRCSQSRCHAHSVHGPKGTNDSGSGPPGAPATVSVLDVRPPWR